MAKGINKVILIGNIGNELELKKYSNGGSHCLVSLATSEQWRDKNTGEQQQRTEWHRVVMNNKLAEIACQYLTKGSKVYIEGYLQTRKWQNQLGQNQYTTEVRANEMQMLSSRNAAPPVYPDPTYQPSETSQFNNIAHTGHAEKNNPNTVHPSSPTQFNTVDVDIPF